MLLFAIALAAVAVSFAWVAIRRLRDDERRTHIDELDDYAYQFDLDTPQRLEYFSLVNARKEGKEAPSTNTLMVALLNRAAAVLPYVERVERDRPRLHKLHRHSYVPTSVLDELVASEHELQGEVEDVRAEAERLRAGWGREIFAQAYHIARKRHAEAMHAAGQAQRGAGSWSQSGTHLTLGLPLPPSIRRENVIVNFEQQACVIIVGGHGPRRIELERPVKPDECHWSVRDDGTLQIVLEKEASGMWKGPHKAQ
ncbi:hypothetical protein KFE25_008765 [Diacronema lutheri]|uniref:CS domain-containing protein n=1 Tax=Diacronema lutheri TaxID=2081491 RepID=A0A7R9YKD8_DIALT|nr:hypothetical protein KFE25_008765 [Diacronema lutheri]|mmetsp:Transcript_19655/g.61154  ORF Transcript_19655/g.61154 Transcript_19655/m.61154 type:complete len:255 (+) Transcript_19655:50-814(+)